MICFLFIILQCNFILGETEFAKGIFNGFLNALPHSQLPHVPLLGNGRIGLAFDSSNSDRNSFPFHGSKNSIDIYINTNSFWSCVDKGHKDCIAADPDGAVEACCEAAVVGGINISLKDNESLGELSFSAEQIIKDGKVKAILSTNQGSTFTLSAFLDSETSIAVVESIWISKGNDSESINLSISLWIEGAKQSSCLPKPINIGCSTGNFTLTNCEDNDSLYLFGLRSASTSENFNKTMPALAALAASFSFYPSTPNGMKYKITSPLSPSLAAVVTSTFSLSNSTTLLTTIVEEESRGINITDPTSKALSTLASSSIRKMLVNNEMFFADFWGKSSISLPSRKRIQDLWYGALHILQAVSSDDGQVAAGGLYGPWATEDIPAWHGDFTLDYNYQATFFGSFGANHPERVQSYYKPILDFIPAGLKKAQVQAKLAQIQCPSNALYYDCHIVPLGFASLDTMNPYMSWNGHFASLAFISNFEYTRDVDFVQNYTLPLLEGLNAWWGCYLNKTVDSDAPDGYYYKDFNIRNPDFEHEGQKVPNPTIAMAFVERTINAHLNICRLLNIECPEIVKDISTHLPPRNVALDGSVFVAYDKASIKDSDWFSNYYLWPTEALDLWTLDRNETLIKLAENSSQYYLDFLGRGVDVFSMYIKTRGGSKTTSTDILNGFELFMDKNWGSNLLNYAEGGGIENVGMIQGINEMLLYSSATSLTPLSFPENNFAEYYVTLFPFWPKNESASFTNLLAKGGHLFSATYNSNMSMVESPFEIIAKYKDVGNQNNKMDSRVSILNPWIHSKVNVLCEGLERNFEYVDKYNVISFDTLLKERCFVYKKSNKETMMEK